MPRLHASSLAALLAFALAGCGGGNGVSYYDPDGNGGNGGGGDNGNTTDLRAAAGSYTATLTGVNDASPPVSFTGTAKTATVSSNGTVGLAFDAVTGGSSSPARTVTATISSAGAVTTADTTIDGALQTTEATGNTWTRNTNGSYTLVLRTSVGGLIATDTYVLRPSNVAFTVTGTRVDSTGRNYSASGSQLTNTAVTAALTSGNALTLSYYLKGANLTTYVQFATALQTGGTLQPGLISLNGLTTTPFTGTWSANSNGSVGIVLKYAYPFAPNTPTVTETLTLTKN